MPDPDFRAGRARVLRNLLALPALYRLPPRWPVADAMGRPMSIGQQLGLLVFMIIASKGAAGVTGAGLATLAGGLQSHRPDLLDGVGLIVGIDRFMSEARALTNFAGNAVATVLVGTWTGEFDREQARAVLAGERPFDETSMLDEYDAHGPADPSAAPPEAAPSQLTGARA
ncbi:cation:dicarboxylate symporter family transporter [Micromonospora olivasterospora]|uniref:Sodium:dicarboxylate symporter family protein n=1 Tax=Micromonospora olivasterospora TaxID=1880 RepID=A0A562IEJ7_MICOL|nr:sodium:dicarboxylate symporter family protein [Micromonospora olivasterospora]